MNPIDWVQESSALIGGIVGALIVLGLLSLLPSKMSSKANQPQPVTASPYHQFFVIFAGVFICIAAMEDILRISSSSLHLPVVAKYMFGVIAALGQYVGEIRRKR